MPTPTPPITPLELLRRLENLVRQGTILDVDTASALVRVQTGGLSTAWLPWFERRAGDVSTWCLPSVGEQCVVISPGGETTAGLVLVGLYSDAHPAPSSTASLARIAFPDGATIDYDHAAHALAVVLPAGGSAHIVAPGSVVIDSPQTTITGACTVQGLLTYQAGMAGSSGGGAAATIEGNVVIAGGDVTADGISLKTHPHGGVAQGDDLSGAPQA